MHNKRMGRDDILKIEVRNPPQIGCAQRTCNADKVSFHSGLVLRPLLPGASIAASGNAIALVAPLPAAVLRAPGVARVTTLPRGRMIARMIGRMIGRMTVGTATAIMIGTAVTLVTAPAALIG